MTIISPPQDKPFFFVCDLEFLFQYEVLIFKYKSKYKVII